jgi:hypothetical protein
LEVSGESGETFEIGDDSAKLEPPFAAFTKKSEDKSSTSSKKNKHIDLTLAFSHYYPFTPSSLYPNIQSGIFPSQSSSVSLGPNVPSLSSAVSSGSNPSSSQILNPTFSSFLTSYSTFSPSCTYCRHFVFISFKYHQHTSRFFDIYLYFIFYFNFLVVFAHHIQENEKEKELCKFILIRFR